MNTTTLAGDSLAQHQRAEEREHVQAAIQTIARHLAHRRMLDSEAVSEFWEDYPEVGEHDWTEVVRAAMGVVPPVPRAEYVAAMKLLMDRAVAQ